MTVEFNHDAVMRMFEQKRKKFLTKTGLQGENLAVVNSRVDTGASKNAKYFSLNDPTTVAKFKDRVFILAPLTYDVYLERRYGIMAKTLDELIPYMAKFEEEIFG
jgi:hypothetical protein